MVNAALTADSLNLIAGRVSVWHRAAICAFDGSGARTHMLDGMTDTVDDTSEPPKKVLSPAAKRALAEAEERRKARDEADPLKPEKGGPKGVEPTRYGDWERGGIAYDF